MLKNVLVGVLCTFLLGSTLMAQVAQPVEIATNHIRQNLKELDLTSADVAEFVVRDNYISKHNQLTHLYLIQSYQGIEVYNAMINVNILPDGEILNMGNRFQKNLADKVNTTTPQISMEEAILSLLSSYGIQNDAMPQLQERINEREAIFMADGFSLEPIPVELIFQPMPDNTVRLAWNVIILNLDAQNWWNARIDAVDGKLLNVFDQIVHCDFGSTEICEAHGVDHSTHRHYTSTSTKVEKELTNSVGSYNVFPIPVESPNHGNRALVTDPDDPIASPFGWHDTDGNEGPEYTITRGNNVHAYHDIFNQNVSPGGEPDGGPGLVFDFPLNLADNTPYVYLDAATTNLFYWNNLMHDVWYLYGFDEASGNFQENNYGNGGNGGDSVNAEALDGSGTNNANFGTPPDGSNPRMQMYLWQGSLPTFDFDIEVTAPTQVAGFYEFALALFGGELPDPDNPVVSEVVLVDDGEGEATDACDPIINGADLDGKVALIDRGSCEFGFKSLAAEDEGAIAVIICNNEPGGGLVNMAPGAVGDQVTIPAIFMTFEDCEVLKTGLPGLTIALAQPGLEVPNPGPTGLDSDYDNVVIAHEYTHGISIRLTGGPGTSGCLTNVEQAGEGWSDWFGLAMTTNSDNFAEQRRGVGTYLINQPTTGTGIRTFPYTRDMNINSHTYTNINNESVPHGVGSVFAATIWDLYWDMVDVYGFDNDLYYGNGGNNMTMQLVLDGLKLQPCNPNFIEARDAIIAADQANYDGVNECLIWETFARRGIGLSATPGGGEAFDVPLACSQSFSVKKTLLDDFVSAGDIVTYQLEINNTRPDVVPNAVVTDELPEGVTFIEGSSSCDITESNGILTVNLGNVQSDENIICTYQVQIANSPFSIVNLEDNAEEGTGNWNFVSPQGPAIWVNSNQNSNTGDFSFFAFNTEVTSDQIMVLSEPILLEGVAPALSFWHFYNTEADWDGGVVEVSFDGVNWEDLGPSMIANGYNSTLNENPASPISGRPAFNGNSGGWIQTIVDLSNFEESQIQVRFRLGCDGAVAEEGWYVDDIQFFDNLYSITNIACVDDQGQERCSEVTTVVNAGVSNTNNQLKDAFSVALFPNPTTGLITLQVKEQGFNTVDLSVKAVDGRTLLNQQANDPQNIQLDLADYGAGIYFVELRTEEGIVVKRVVVE